MITHLTGTVQPYAWGSTTFIPELLGEKPTGDPQAELWLGAHPSAPAQLDGTSLADVVAADPAGVVGEAAVAEFGPRLPYLLKVLAAAKPLSLQAHPSRAQAEAGHAREDEAGVAADAPNRLYRDDWPKPEMLCALTPTEALCGFRDPRAAYALFAELGDADALELVAPLADESLDPAERLETVFERLLRLSEDELAVVDAVVAAAGSAEAGSGDFATFVRTARELGEAYPRDPGVLAALMMNRIGLEPHQAVFLPAGNLHAYLNGGGVEIMANSDNVMRGGLTPKHIDVDELLAILDFTPGFPGYVEQVPEGPGVWRYDTPAPEFALWRVELNDHPVSLPATERGRVALLVDGRARMTGAGVEVDLVRGQSAFASANEDLEVAGSGVLFVAGPGV